MNYDWIGPAVTAAIITAIVTLFTSHRNYSLTQITSERSAWRLRIKEAIQNLLVAFNDARETELALQKIKSEINPYGRFTTSKEIEQAAQNANKFRNPLRKLLGAKKKKSKEDASYYLRDGHIWKAISDYEADLDNHKKLEALIVMLELLLKFDWDRSKREVAGFTTLLPTIISCAVGAVSFAFGITNRIDFWGIGRVFAISLFFILFPPYCSTKSSATRRLSIIKSILVSILVTVPFMTSYLFLFTEELHFSWLAATIAFGTSGFLSIIATTKRDIEWQYISMIQDATNKMHSKT